MISNERNEDIDFSSFCPPLSFRDDEEIITALTAAYRELTAQCPTPTRLRNILIAPALATDAERTHVYESDCRFCKVSRESFADFPHPAPITLAFNKSGRLSEMEHEAVDWHLSSCNWCQAVVRENWMDRVGRLVEAGVEGISQARNWLSRAARLSFNMPDALAYSSRKESREKPYSLRYESGDFIVHIERTEDAELRIIILAENSIYAGQNVLVILIGRDATIRREIILSNRGDFPAAGSAILGTFSELAPILEMAELFVIPQL